MPRYDYQCDQCQAVFEIRATIKEKEAGLEPGCPMCHGKQAHQVITAGLIIRSSGGSSFSGSCCGPNSGSGCCG